MIKDNYHLTNESIKNSNDFVGTRKPFFFPSGPAPELLLIYILILVWSKGDSINDLKGNLIANG